MNKGDYIKAVVKQLAKKDGLYYKEEEIRHIYEAGFKVLIRALRRDGKVGFVNFGSFSIKRKPRHKGRNPRNNAELYIPAHNTIHFSAGKLFKDSIQ